MFFRQLYDEGLAQASYVIGCDRCEEALVVDPRRDIDAYLTLARAEDLRITAVAETHIHADFLSGGRELAAATGATLYVSGHAQAGEGYLPDQPGINLRLVTDGEVLTIGEVRARVRHTPGHTPEHICLDIFESSARPQPMMLLSGDFIFVGDLGRPDLLEQALGKEGAAKDGARSTFASLRSAVRELPGFIVVGLYLFALPPLLARTVMRPFFLKMGFVRFFILVTLMQFMAALPIKMVLRWSFNLKYIVYIPEIFFNI